jgi:hypothetical protein
MPSCLARFQSQPNAIRRSVLAAPQSATRCTLVCKYHHGAALKRERKVEWAVLGD